MYQYRGLNYNLIYVKTINTSHRESQDYKCESVLSFHLQQPLAIFDAFSAFTNR